MKYLVRSFSQERWDEEPCEVDAESCLEAAQKLCGGPLEYVGHLRELRAEVWPISNPAMKLLLYRRVS